MNNTHIDNNVAWAAVLIASFALLVALCAWADTGSRDTHEDELIPAHITQP